MQPGERDAGFYSKSMTSCILAKIGTSILMGIVFKVAFALLFIVGGGNHMIDPDFYVRIMPPYIPWPQFFVYVSGIFEIVLGSMLLIPALTRWAAWGLIALLIAIFPANVQMALYPELYPKLPAIALWLRLPVQGVLIAWAYHYTRKARST